jgi:hypothetical protein
MMFHTTKLIFVAATGLFISFIAMQAVASDRSIRCGTYLIYGGGGKDSTSMYEVLKKCGEPEAKNGNTWIYIQGSMVRSLTFNYEGKLATIESQRK